MSIENNPGEITVHIGPMFSGKTTALVGELVVAANVARLVTQAFKPDIDNRGEGPSVIKSKGAGEFPAQSISTDSPWHLLPLLQAGIQVVGIDEAQFFNSAIVEVARELSGKGVTVIISGLPTDFRNEPFGSMPILMAIAENLISHRAICTHGSHSDSKLCRAPATRTQRIINGQPAPWNSPVVVVGGNELYEARCVRHHHVPR